MKSARKAAPAAGVVTFFFCKLALAQTSAITAQVSPPSATEGLLHSLFGLIVIVALIFSAGWAIKRFRPQMQSRSGLTVLGSTSVGTRERVVLVRYQDEVLVLGVAPGQVSLLKSGPAPAEDLFAAGSPPHPFVVRLKAAMKGSRGQ